MGVDLRLSYWKSGRFDSGRTPTDFPRMPPIIPLRTIPKDKPATNYRPQVSVLYNKGQSVPALLRC